MIRVLIFDPDPTMRMLLRSLLGRDEHILVTAEVPDIRQALDISAAANPDAVVLSDAVASADTIRAIRTRAGTARIIVLATYQQSVLTHLADGADECVLKDQAARLLADCIRRGVQGPRPPEGGPPPDLEAQFRADP